MFLPRAIYLTLDDMAAFIAAIPSTGWQWSPTGITWHNSASPSLAQWDSYPTPARKAWGDNYNHYCKFDQRWHSGPHFVGAPDESIVLCEPRADGVHCSCNNHIHFGVETIGDFRQGGDDPHSGRGLLSVQASANIIAALCKRMGYAPRQAISFHRECPADHHDCPGAMVTNDWAIGLVEERLKQLGGEQPPPASYDLETIAGLQGALRALGFLLKADGCEGPQTVRAIREFQANSGLKADGIAGPITRAAILKALAALS